MRNTIFGTASLVIAALLYATHYLAAAIFMGPGLTNWDADLFQNAYSYIGYDLDKWAVLALIIGSLSLMADYLKRIWRFINTPSDTTDVQPVESISINQVNRQPLIKQPKTARRIR